MNKLKSAANYVWRERTVYIILAFLIILFSVLNPVFFTGRNFYNLLTQSTYYIIAGMGIAFVMMSGGIDLSVGYEMAIPDHDEPMSPESQFLGAPITKVPELAGSPVPSPM